MLRLACLSSLTLAFSLACVPHTTLMDDTASGGTGAISAGGAAGARSSEAGAAAATPQGDAGLGGGANLAGAGGSAGWEGDFPERFVVSLPSLIQDAYVMFRRDGAERDSNFGSESYLIASAWNTKPSVSDPDAVAIRTVVYLRFDLGKLPRRDTIVRATLFLFSDPETDPTVSERGHSTLSGDNDFWIETVLGAWDETTVSWRKAPEANVSTTPMPETPDSLHFPGTKSFDEDLKLDVTKLVQSTLLRTSPNYGFFLHLNEPTEYRKVRFASSDHPNPQRRPRLEILYYR